MDIKGRVNFWNSIHWNWSKKGQNDLLAPSFKTGTIPHLLHSEPRLTYKKEHCFCVTASYEYVKRTTSLLYGGEHALFNTINLEAKYNAFSSTNLTGKFTYSNISFTGATNTTVSYIMLKRCCRVRTICGSIDLTKRFINNLELSFEYEGRKPGTDSTVNIGRASLRVLL